MPRDPRADAVDPTEEERLDRLVACRAALETGQPWGDEEWRRYRDANRAGEVEPLAVLRGTSGSLKERIRLAEALLALGGSGAVGLRIYTSLLGAAGRVQFGGGGGFLDALLGNVVRRPGYSIGWRNVVYLEPGLAGAALEVLVAFIAHECYHARQPNWRWPFTRREETRAFAQEAQVWEGLRAGYSGPQDAYLLRLEGVLAAFKAGDLDGYVRSQPIYRRWFYRP